MSNVPNYMILELDGEELYIEVPEKGRQAASYNNNSFGMSEIVDPLRLSGDQLKKLVKIAGKLFDQFKEFRSDEMEISFNLKVDAEAKIFMLASADVEGEFGVKLKWKDRNKNEENKTD